MSDYQTNFNAYVGLKKQTAKGSKASGAGAVVLPITGGKMSPKKQAISSAQVRRDGLSTRGRHGLQSLTATYNGELQLSNFDVLFSAVMRGNFANGAGVTQGTGAMSSATVSTSGSTITFSAGNVITAGLRAYDVVTFTAGLNAADLNKPLRVLGVTATTVTVAETLATVTSIATWSFSVKGRKLINPPAGSLVKSYFTVEEAEVDADQSLVAADVRVGKIDLAMQPNGMITLSVMLMGTGDVTPVTGASSPYFPSPTETVAIPLAAVDAQMLVGGTTLLDVTAFSLSLDLGLSAPAVAAAKVSPDVFDGSFKVSGSITTLREDLQAVVDFLGETPLALMFTAIVPDSDPADFISVVVPNFTLGDVDVSEIKKEGGARTQTLQIPAELVGVDERGGAYDATMVKLQVSNAS